MSRSFKSRITFDEIKENTHARERTRKVSQFRLFTAIDRAKLTVKKAVQIHSACKNF